jgi:hypothetical protein
MFLLLWIFAAGYLIGYVHHGQRDALLYDGLLSGALPRPFLATTSDDLSPTLSVADTSVPKPSSPSSSLFTSAKSAAAPSPVPVSRAGNIPIATAFSTVLATNATQFLAERHHRTRERIKAGYGFAQADLAKVRGISRS